MKKVTKFETSDKKLFDSEVQAQQHETMLAQRKIDAEEKQQLEKEIREEASKLIILLEKYTLKNEINYDLSQAKNTLENIVDGDTIDYYDSEEYYDSGC